MKITTKFLLAFALIFSNSAFAQRVVEFVIPFAQGGTADRLAAVVMPFLKQELAQINVNPVLAFRPGAGGALGAGQVAKADRLQILLAANALVTVTIVNPQAVTYSLEKDFVPLVYLGRFPMLLIVKSTSPINTWQDLKSHCKSNTISMGNSGVGSATHIAATLVTDFIGCKTTHIPYKGIGQAMVDLLGNHTDALVDFVPSAKQHLDSGNLKAILSVDQQRFDNVPSVKDIGFTNYDFDNWFVLAVNSNAPQAEIQQMQQALNAVMQKRELLHQLEQLGVRGYNANLPSNFFVVQQQRFRQILRRVNVQTP